jgi:hypothetical protein
MVQFSWPGRRGRQSCIYYCADDLCCSCYEFADCGWRVHICTVSPISSLLAQWIKLIIEPACRGRQCYLPFWSSACSAQFAHSRQKIYIESFSGLPQSIVSYSQGELRISSPNNSLVIASVAICIALLVLTPNKQSAKWVFTEVTDGSGWGSKGFSFLLGQVPPCSYSIKGTDHHPDSFP